MWDIINANCMDVMNDIVDENTIIVTDPPFNIGYRYNGYRDNLKETEYFELVGGC